MAFLVNKSGLESPTRFDVKFTITTSVLALGVNIDSKVPKGQVSNGPIQINRDCAMFSIKSINLRRSESSNAQIKGSILGVFLLT